MQEALGGQRHGVVPSQHDGHAPGPVPGPLVEKPERKMIRRLTELAAYGLDAGTNLAILLRTVDGLSGEFRVRVGMADPLTVYPIVDELVEAYHSDKIFKFLHLPVQSGDDAILEAMRREYSVAQFEEIVHARRR